MQELDLTSLDNIRNAADELRASAPEARAEIQRDTAQAAAIWKSTDQVWWPGGPGDPTLRVLRVEPTMAEPWDGPSSVAVAAFEFVEAKLTGSKPNLGENRKISVPLR